jgi:hypothetical protein
MSSMAVTLVVFVKQTNKQKVKQDEIHEDEE